MAKFQAAVHQVIKKQHTVELLENRLERVLYPTKPDSTLQRIPVNGGTSISEDLANKLRTLAFGPSDMVSFTSGDWLESSFSFNEPGSSKAWALKVKKEGSKGLIMCVQAYFLKHLLFSRRRTRGMTDLNLLLRPEKKTQEECLCSAISDILWKAGDKQKATLCLLHDKAVLEDTEFFRGDGVTEKVRFFSFKKHDDLNLNIKKYLYQFVEVNEDGGCGTTLFLYSLILTRGIERLRSEMEDKQPSAINGSGKLCKSIANLILTGRATPYFHNGIIYEGTEATMAVQKTGTLLRSEIGFLLWEGINPKNRIHVGSRLKTPTYPIWVTLCEESYGVLFNSNKELMRDYHAENRFDIFYYCGKEEKENLTTLTIDSREPKFLDPYAAPPLELLIQTKWEDATVDWNGEAPYM